MNIIPLQEGLLRADLASESNDGYDADLVSHFDGKIDSLKLSTTRFHPSKRNLKKDTQKNKMQSKSFSNFVKKTSPSSSVESEDSFTSSRRKKREPAFRTKSSPILRTSRKGPERAKSSPVLLSSPKSVDTDFESIEFSEVFQVSDKADFDPFSLKEAHILKTPLTTQKPKIKLVSDGCGTHGDTGFMSPAPLTGQDDYTMTPKTRSHTLSLRDVLSPLRKLASSAKDSPRKHLSHRPPTPPTPRTFLPVSSPSPGSKSSHKKDRIRHKKKEMISIPWLSPLVDAWPASCEANVQRQFDKTAEELSAFENSSDFLNYD
jgi:hypothetical protein